MPLGGARFTKIEERFRQEQATSDDDDASESGEGRRLGTGSFLTGSSSASKGAGAGRQHRASPGLASSGTSSLTLNANGGSARLSSPTTADDDDDDDGEYLPPYGPAARGKARGAACGLRVRAVAIDSGDEQDDAYGSSATGVLNFGESSNKTRSRFDDDIRKSVEMEDMYPGSSHHESGSWTQQAWSFGPSASGSGNHNSPGSDGADVDELELGDAATATGSDTRDPDMMSMGTADHQDVDLSFLSSAVPVTALGGDSADSSPPPPPDMLTQANMEDIQQQVWARKSDAVHTITMSDNGADVASDNAVDIHVSEDEAGKMED